MNILSPYSLYIPEAGFIWSDDYVWSHQAGVFELDSAIEPSLPGTFPASKQAAAIQHLREEPAWTSLHRRVIFKDSIGRYSQLSASFASTC